MLARSYLYVPGDAPDKLAKALDRGADGVFLDLEDAVPPAAKDAARDLVADRLRGLPAAADGTTEVWVRINPGPTGHRDVRAVVCPALTGVLVAKAESAAELRDLDAVLSEAEAARGLPIGTVAVAPLLESAAALLRAEEIATAPRVQRLQLGEADLVADLGITVGPDERELDHVRSVAVLVSAAAGLRPPVAPVSTDFADLDRLERSTRALARRGYVGRACIHPAQIPVVNAVFTPAAEEVAAARDLLERFDRAGARGSGVALSADGRLVDEAVVRRARLLLERSRS